MDQTEIINRTLDFMIISKTQPNEMVQSPRKIFSPFGIICKKILGKYCFKTTTNLVSMWKRNQKGSLLISDKFYRLYLFN